MQRHSMKYLVKRFADTTTMIVPKLNRNLPYRNQLPRIHETYREFLQTFSQIQRFPILACFFSDYNNVIFTLEPDMPPYSHKFIRQTVRNITPNIWQTYTTDWPQSSAVTEEN